MAAKESKKYWNKNIPVFNPLICQRGQEGTMTA
jgi:hypothetical protein